MRGDRFDVDDVLAAGESGTANPDPDRRRVLGSHAAACIAFCGPFVPSPGLTYLAEQASPPHGPSSRTNGPLSTVPRLPPATIRTVMTNTTRCRGRRDRFAAERASARRVVTIRRELHKQQCPDSGHRETRNPSRKTHHYRLAVPLPV